MNNGNKFPLVVVNVVKDRQTEEQTEAYGRENGRGGRTRISVEQALQEITMKV